jgi:hypothetical protein
VKRYALVRGLAVQQNDETLERTPESVVGQEDHIAVR